MSEEWYSNKELFEQLNQFRSDFQDLRLEMEQTRSMIKKYNGLREEVGEARKEVKETRSEVDEVKTKVQTLQAKSMGRFSVWEGFRTWGGWVVALLAMIAAYIKIFL